MPSAQETGEMTGTKEQYYKDIRLTEPPPAQDWGEGVKRMPEGDMEVVHQSGKWRVRIQGHETLPGEYDTKAAAVGVGRDGAKARGVQLIVRNQDDTISDRDSHGHDARDIPG